MKQRIFPFLKFTIVDGKKEEVKPLFHILYTN